MLLEPREVPLGGPRAMLVRRTLPHRALRTVGPFCFVDHYGPSSGDDMVVPPHPHTGLQTVSWLLTGAVDHRDSIGSVQRIRPGELNLMTSGHGVVHSEYRAEAGPLHGIQLWVALPDSDRHQPPHFEHHAELPRAAGGGLTATVVMGEQYGATSPAATYSPLVCTELRLSPGHHVVPVDTSFEHGLLLVDGDLDVDGVEVPHGSMLFRPPGAATLPLQSGAGSVVLLIGGEPFGEELLMWWNFVGRTHDEIVAARTAWASGDARFGPVVDDDAEPLPAPTLPLVRLKARPNHPARPDPSGDAIPPGVF